VCRHHAASRIPPEIPSTGGVAAAETAVAEADGVGFSVIAQPTPTPLALAPSQEGPFSSNAPHYPEFESEWRLSVSQWPGRPLHRLAWRVV
jgi:hypothetical protein